jgi:hypothetical protein
LESIIEELKGKRTAIEVEVLEAEARIKALREDMAAIDRVIRIYDPSQAPAEVRPKRKRAVSATLPEALAKTNKTAAILDVLREAGRPLTTAECIDIIVDRHQVELDPATQDKFTTQVSASLSSLVKRGRVRHAGTMEGNKRLWEIAA